MEVVGYVTSCISRYVPLTCNTYHIHLLQRRDDFVESKMRPAHIYLLSQILIYQ